MKRVSILIRGAPFSSWNSWEGLRTALGLTLRDHRVRVIFIEEGVYNLLPLSPKSLGLRDFDQFLKTLVELEIPLIVEREAVEERGLKDLACNPQVISREEIQDMLREDTSVIAF